MGFGYTSENKKKGLSQVIMELINSSSARDIRRILEQNPELLSAETDSILNDLSKNASEDPQIKEIIDSHRTILARCREVGVAQTFEEILSFSNEMPDELQTILEEIDQLHNPQDLPKKILLIQYALSFVHIQSIPILWAGLHVDLGKCLCEDPKGDRAENLETAIEHFNWALKVYTQKDFPVEWATMQHNLGFAFESRVMGDRAENIEKAIEHYRQALKVRNQRDFPVEWAMTQNNLGIAHNKRIRGDRTENIKKAIEHYNQALKVFTQKNFPTDWANIQHNLAIVTANISGKKR